MPEERASRGEVCGRREMWRPRASAHDAASDEGTTGRDAEARGIHGSACSLSRRLIIAALLSILVCMGDTGVMVT